MIMQGVWKGLAYALPCMLYRALWEDCFSLNVSYLRDLMHVQIVIHILIQKPTGEGTTICFQI